MTEETAKKIETCGLAIASLVLGLASLVACAFTGIPAIICGHVAVAKIKRSNGTLAGNGMAVTGLIMGYLVTLLSGALFLLAILGMLAGMTLPAISSARERARRTSCMSHLSQMGKAMKMYSMDHEEQFPTKFSQLKGYINNPKLYICPSSKVQPGSMSNVDSWTTYTLVPGLKESDSVTAVHVYCDPANHQGRGGNILFLDSSVTWEDAATFQQTINDN